MLAIDSTLWAAWVGALGTVAAFIAAAIGFIYNLYANRRDNRSAQARLFDLWVAETTDGISGHGTPDSILTLTMSNASAQAIRDVTVRFEGDGKVFKEYFLGIVPPTPTAPLDRTIDFPEDIRSLGLPIQICFTDANGNFWQRTPEGYLLRQGSRAARRLDRQRVFMPTLHNVE